nr:hypothetical protein [uncultured Rhodoferax sp.]
MPFFKPYSGTTSARLLRLERLVWILIYGGLLSIVLGYFLEQQGQDASWFWQLGGLAVAAGVVAVFVRARLREE